MKYLVIEDKHTDVNVALRIIREYHPATKYPHFKNRKPQFFFQNSELTREEVKNIAMELGMEVVTMSRERAVIGSFGY